MKEMNVLNIFSMNLMQHLIFMYKFKNGQLPQNFLKYFRTSESERYNLRSNKSDSFCLPFKQSKFTEHSIFYRGPRLWNTFLDKEITSSKSLFTFKKKLKSFLLNN